jgi:hypothetical protein
MKKFDVEETQLSTERFSELVRRVSAPALQEEGKVSLGTGTS